MDKIIKERIKKRFKEIFKEKQIGCFIESVEENVDGNFEEHFEEILKEFKNGYHFYTLASQHENWFNAFCHSNEFPIIINKYLKIAIDRLDFERINMIVWILQAQIYNEIERTKHFELIMDFLLLYSENGNIDKFEFLLAQALDIFWHQEKGLMNLDKEVQEKLCSILILACNFKYEVTENGDEIFHAIKKSMDLIKYQNEYGDSTKLHFLFESHFDPKIRERYNENKNWL